jgi:hypothetical protein
MDQYGGLVNVPSPNGATGSWRVEKFGSRWLLVTPAGNAFWSFGVFNVERGDQTILAAKYGDSSVTWAKQAVRRLRSWGFNTILDHYSLYAHPIQNSEKMAAVGFTEGARYPVRNVNNYAPQSAKDIFNPMAINLAYYGGRYMAPSTDPFDPNFAAWINTYMKNFWEAAGYGSDPHVIGFSTGESDYMCVFGAGSSADFPTFGGGENSPHLGWAVLLTAPTQSVYYSQWGQINYSDTTVYAKQALKNFLQARYGTIAALNTAWSSTYTTFDSSGGWGTGTGLLDEDGRNPWVPKDIPGGDTLVGATAAMKKDLDDFLFTYAAQFFKVQRDAVKNNYPGKLYLGPNVIGSWGTPPRRQILQAAGQYIDILMTSLGGSPNDQQRLDFLMQYLGDKPIASWIGITANPDSAIYWAPNPRTALTANTQAARGQLYNQWVTWYFNATVSSSVPGVGGTKPFVGIRWWAWNDSGTEGANWGLVTPYDNVYDGFEDKSYGCTPGNPAGCNACTDPWGYHCGAEDKDFGDFMSAAKSTHLAIFRALP